MKRTRYTTDQIIEELRQADVALGKGQKVPEVCKSPRLAGGDAHHRIIAKAVKRFYASASWRLTRKAVLSGFLARL